MFFLALEVVEKALGYLFAFVGLLVLLELLVESGYFRNRQFADDVNQVFELLVEGVVHYHHAQQRQQKAFEELLRRPHTPLAFDELVVTLRKSDYQLEHFAVLAHFLVVYVVENYYYQKRLRLGRGETVF